MFPSFLRYSDASPRTTCRGTNPSPELGRAALPNVYDGCDLDAYNIRDCSALSAIAA